MKKRILALLCALVLLLGGLLPAWASQSNTTVYLLAANDKFYDGYPPVAVNGTIYVPYTIFDKDATGVDLGVYYGLKQEQGTILSLYSINGNLTFRVIMGLCEDGQGNPMNFRALPRRCATSSGSSTPSCPPPTGAPSSASPAPPIPCPTPCFWLRPAAPCWSGTTTSSRPGSPPPRPLPPPAPHRPPPLSPPPRRTGPTGPTSGSSWR